MNRLKPLSEFAEELRGKKALVYFSEDRAFNAGMAHAADLLQAWLREADEYLRVEAKLCEGAAETRSGDVKQHYGGRIFSCGRFREVLLGTTQKGK